MNKRFGDWDKPRRGHGGLDRGSQNRGSAQEIYRSFAYLCHGAATGYYLVRYFLSAKMLINIHYGTLESGVVSWYSNKASNLVLARLASGARTCETDFKPLDLQHHLQFHFPALPGNVSNMPLSGNSFVYLVLPTYLR